MIISQKFKRFNAEWDMERPDNVLIDAFDVSYDTDVQKLIEFVSEIMRQRQTIQLNKEETK